MPLTCVIVDDSPDFLESAAHLLDAEGTRVLGLCRTSAEAVVLLATVTPDVMLVDVELGDEDGVEVAGRLSVQVPSTVVILVSSRDGQELRESLDRSRITLRFLPKDALSTAAIVALLT